MRKSSRSESGVVSTYSTGRINQPYESPSSKPAIRPSSSGGSLGDTRNSSY